MKSYVDLCLGFLAAIGILALMWGLVSLVRWLL